MGNVPELDDKRNKELIADYQAKTGKGFEYTTAELVGKYMISSSRIYEIFDKYEVARRSPRKIKKAKK